MPRVQLDILGKSGLNAVGGYVIDDTIKNLSGPQGRNIFREMEYTDPIIGAMLFAIEYYLRQMKVIIEPGDKQDARAQELAEFCKSLFSDMSSSWEETLSEIVTMLPYGWAYLEIVYKLRKGETRNPKTRSKYTDGKFGWRKLALRSQLSLDKWELDEDGGIRGMWQVAPPNYQRIFIPIEKALLFRTTARYSNPEGKSVLTNAYRPWYFKRQLEQIEAIGMERDLTGLPIAWVPTEIMMSDATDDEKQIYAHWKNIVSKTKRNELEGIVAPMDYDAAGNKRYDFQLLASAGERQLDIGSAIARHKQEMAMTVLADWILLGHEKIGTQALSITKSEIFQKALQGWADAICDVFNSHAFRRIATINGFANVPLPMLRMVNPPSVNLDELGRYVSALAGANILFPDEPLVQFLREVATMPEAEQEVVEDGLKKREEMLTRPPENPISQEDEDEEVEEDDRA